MIIALRYGHSFNCTGAVGIVNETEQMQKYYEAIKKLLESYGHIVIDCNSNANTQGEELSEGATKANNANVDIFISLHMNCFNGQAKGTEVLVSSASSKAYPYALKLVNNFSELGFINRGVKFEKLYEMNHILAPNIISEICFCDSATDVAIYNQYSWDKLAHVLCNAIDSNIPKDVLISENKIGWIQNTKGWQYKTSDGSYSKDCWQKIDNEWYYFSNDEYAKQNTWFKDTDGKWYWLKDNCVMAKSCWLWINSECYCFSSSGALYINCKTPDGYYVDETGAWFNIKK